MQQVEGELLDLRLRARPAAPPSDSIVLVLIDDASLRSHGRWPWSRRVIAELVDRLQEAGVRTIGLSLLLPEPQIATVPATDLAPLIHGETATLGRLASLLAQADGDRKLAAELQQGDVVMPILFSLATQEQANEPAVPSFVADTAFRVVQQPGTELADPPTGSDLLAPIIPLGRAAATLGHVNVPLDPTGAQRLEYPVVRHGADYYPSFSLEIARHFLEVERDRSRLLLGEGIALGDRLVPTDESMRLPVTYRRARFPAVSAAAVLDRTIDPAMFENKIALVGGTAAGVGTTLATPFLSMMPEIERHATVVDSILQRDFLVRREASVLVDLLAVIVTGVLIGWLGSRFGVPGATAVFLAATLGLTAANLIAFLYAGLWLNLFLPLLAMSIIYGVVLVYSYVVGKRQERMIRAAFEHYLSPDLVDLVCRDPSLLQLGGERRELTVLFADIRDSTALAQRLAPERFAELLNDILGSMTDALFARGGMLDKFTGDGLLAIFGAPLPQEDHALRACHTALDMLRAVDHVRARWAEENLPIEIGVGINSGPMIIGNMGSRERFAYTVIGDEAHLGARLEAANKEFATHILISEATYTLVREQLAAREIDTVKFRGLDQPVRVFELVG